MRIIVTCGPSFAPLDEVRRITNASTGELGVLLANRLAESGYDVLCLRGTGTTWPEPVRCAVAPFTTNDDLLDRLRAIPEPETISAFFHVAALTDFRVAQIGGGGGAKLSSRNGTLQLTLEPATKLISLLRPLFPAARIVGWKYELDGTRAQVLAKAARQIQENSTDACVVNGRAWGGGFGWVQPGTELQTFADKPALCEFLSGWLG
jgi:phosphopantothenoylcysteine synthetase/decarboxylase